MAAAADVLFRLGGDPALDPVRRGAARVLSFYQRAPVHLLAETGWGEFDWMASSLLRWVLLSLCGRHARRWHVAPRSKPPSSGWSGSLLVITVWLGLTVAVMQAFPVVPNALIG